MGAESTALVPQWNLTLRSPSTYRSYDSLGTSTMTGQVAPVGSVSLVCLSCHDGTQAMSAVINSTSSGSLLRAGAYPLQSEPMTGAVSSVGTDLRDDHPVGVQYGGGGLTETAPSAPDPESRLPGRPRPAVLNEVRYLVGRDEGGGTGTRRKTDLSLYTRTRSDGYTGQSVAEPFVECASCHDPHTDRALFLRISNTRSALCLTCHVL
jgi:predicted CXXCH cytochrome family protein